jgi:hypothetical protein
MNSFRLDFGKHNGIPLKREILEIGLKGGDDRKDTIQRKTNRQTIK